MKIRNEGAKLEGDMWQDDKSPDRINMMKLTRDVPEVMEIRARKEKYWASRKGKEPQLQPQEVVGKSAKKARKKLKKRQAEEEEARKQAVESEDVGKRGDTVNEYIRCSNEVATVTSMRHILDPDNVRHTAERRGVKFIIPFINAKYRARARVVDFLPKPLEEFAVSPLPGDEPEKSSMDIMDYEASPKFEWSFDLLLEDASSGARKEQIWVTVGHEEAQYLFGKDMPDPQNLRHDVRLLTQLREKLCILWGNLEERGEGEAVSNKPFECCVWEYGVEMDDDDPEKAVAPRGWKKML